MKKAIRKIFALTIAMIMVLAMGSMVMAEDNSSGSIKITPPSGLDAQAVNTYKIYKVFDAVVGNSGSISYRVKNGKDGVPAGFKTDRAGNVSYEGDKLTQESIESIRNYVNDEDVVATVQATGSDPVTAGDLPNGYYFISTTTGSVVTIDSTNPNAEVADKNTVPQVDKIITGATSIDEDGKKALAQVGTVVNYSATITVGNGAKGYVFHDTMESGLTYNNDVSVQPDDILFDASKTATGDTFTITFDDESIKGLEVGSTIVVTYSATVNNDAITTDPLNNTCYVSYGDANSSNKTPDSKADVYEAKFTVTKQDGDRAPLAGAGFVLKNSEEKYYKLGTTDTGKPIVSWVDSIDEATEYTSDANGAVPAFTGLANGTYTLEEKTVPAGYNKAEDTTFTIAEHDYTADNLEQKTTVINNAGAELPSTGGMGTTIFYVIGGILVLAAAIILISKRRVQQ